MLENVCGILKPFDELVCHTILIAAQACQFLRQLMHINRRLPAEECAGRIQLWCNT
ncbi:hypothetical protein FLA_3832 [Filimonas lacunae]|nr:hypothetical protein FLA_3832 [Filimonas lacunae]